MKTTVKKKITHDRMTMTVTFDNGDIFKFNISRSSDSLRLSQKTSAEKVTQAEFDGVAKWLKLRDDENHYQRYDRLEAAALKVNSMSTLALMVA